MYDFLIQILRHMYSLIPASQGLEQVLIWQELLGYGTGRKVLVEPLFFLERGFPEVEPVQHLTYLLYAFHDE